MEWLKRKWPLVVGAVGAVIAALITIVTLGRRGKKAPAPEAPILPDVVVTKIPSVNVDFNDRPFDDYKSEKESAQLPTSPDGVIDSLNSRFK